jgi:hypothetical protein
MRSGSFCCLDGMNSRSSLNKAKINKTPPKLLNPGNKTPFWDPASEKRWKQAHRAAPGQVPTHRDSGITQTRQSCKTE